MFSVVIPLYNKELSIGNTIQSVLDQTYQEFEIVVVNDGSTDNSLQIVEQINDPRIRIINKPNGGVSSARNRGIKEAKSEWIALLDGDDLWTPNYLIEMKNLINDFHNNKFFGCNFSTIENGNINERAANLPPNFRGEILDYFDIRKRSPLYYSSSVVLNKESVIRIGGFDEKISIGEDLDVWFRMILNYPNPVFYNRPLALYNKDGENRAMNKKHDIKKSIMYYFEKYQNWEKENIYFAEYINLFKCRKYIDIIKNFDISYEFLKDYINNIDRKYMPLRWKLFFLLPLQFQCKILNHKF